MYWQGGEGPALWCLHGFPDTAETWFDIAPELIQAGYRVIIPQMPGYAPDQQLSDYSVPALARALLDLIAQLCPEQAVRLIGHDWGAVCAYAMAAMQPARIQRMVCAAVPHPRRFLHLTAAQLRRSWYMGFFQLPHWPERRLADPAGDFIERLWRAWSPDWAFAPQDIEPVRLALSEPAVRRAALAYYRALPALLLKPWSRQRAQLLAPCSVPTLSVAGGRDGCIGAQMFEQQAACFSSSFQLTCLDTAGHFMHREQKDLFTAYALEHLA